MIERKDNTYKYQSLEGLYSAEELDAIHHGKVLFAGCGVQSNLAEPLARLGLGTQGLLILADPGEVSRRNIDRQFFKPGQEGKKKPVALAENILELNTEIKILAVNEGITQENVSMLVNQVDIIGDMVDVAHPEIAFILHEEAKKQGKCTYTGFDLGNNVKVYFFDYSDKKAMTLTEMLNLPDSITIEDFSQFNSHAISVQMLIGQNKIKLLNREQALNFYSVNYFTEEKIHELMESIPKDVQPMIMKVLNGELDHIPQTGIGGSLMALVHAQIIENVLLKKPIKNVAPSPIIVNLSEII